MKACGNVVFYFSEKSIIFGEASIFCVFLGGESWNFLTEMSSLQRRVQLKSSLETSHFIPFLVPKKVPEQNRLSFDETGSGSSEHLCYKKIPVKEQLHPSKGLFQSKGCSSCIMHLPLILKHRHRGHSMFGMIRIWNSSTSLELRPFSKASKPRAHKIAKIARLIYIYIYVYIFIQIYDIWCNKYTYV